MVLPAVELLFDGLIDVRRDVFLRFIEKTEPDPDSECLLWKGARTYQRGNGRSPHNRSYGHMKAPLTPSGWAKAHRVAYWLFRPDFDPALDLDHLCQTRLCVNPYHLEQVTSEINNERRFVEVWTGGVEELDW